MNTTARWLIWFITTILIINAGCTRGWNTLHKTLLVLVIVVGVLQVVLPMLSRRMLRKMKAMPPEEREKFISKFDPRTQEKIRKQIETPDAKPPA